MNSEKYIGHPTPSNPQIPPSNALQPANSEIKTAICPIFWTLSEAGRGGMLSGA
jgi:hypothetical protein